MPDATTVIELSVVEERYDPYDPAHATPDPMVRRILKLRLPQGSAALEQTDYGHPGRFNNWEPRGIDVPLQPRTGALITLCEAIAPLV